MGRPAWAPRYDRARDARERLEQERASALARLREMGLASDVEPAGPAVGDTVLEAGDAAQASQRRDMSFADRERLAQRITKLTAALQRIARGTWGLCEICGGEIEPGRLTALPEAATCRACQERLERTRTRSVA
jgi:RNA polymerase-binding transcription factor DksA